MARMTTIALIGFFISMIAQETEARWLDIKEAGSVVERYDVDALVKKDGTSSQTLTYVIRVQGEDAKVSTSLFPIDYNSVTEKVEVLEAYTLNGKEKIPVDPSAIENKDKGESKAYDNMKTLSVVFPKVQIGSKIFIKYRSDELKPMMKDRWSQDVRLPPGFFIEKFRYNVKSEVPLFVEVIDPRGLITQTKKSKDHVEFTNKRVTPGWVHAEKDPYFHMSGDTHIHVSTHQNWKDFYDDLNKDYTRVQSAALPKPLQSWVRDAKKKKDPREQILFLMERMSHDFRYFGDWRRHNGGVVPRELKEIESSRYGDCKDLSTILVAMLRALNIDADIALVRRGDNPWVREPDYNLPDSSHFNHAIVRAKVNGKDYWLDPTNPVSSLEPFPDIAGRPAWILQSGNGHFERLPEAQSKDYVHIHEYDYNFKSMDEVKVKVNATLSRMAPYQLASNLMMSPRSEVLSHALEYFTEGQEVRTFKYTKEPTTTRTLGDMKIGLEYQSGRVTFDAGKAAFFVIPDGFLSGSFYETEDRESDLHISEAPYQHTAIRRLKNAKLVQAKPEPCRIQSDWMNLERKIEVEGKDVVIYQSVELKKPAITKAEFQTPAFRQLQKSTQGCFYRSGVLVESLTGSL